MQRYLPRTISVLWLAAALPPPGTAQDEAGDTRAPAATLERVGQLVGAGKLEEAAPLADQLVKASPDDFERVFLRARIRDELRRYDGAGEDYDRCLELAPDRIDLYQYRGVNRFMRGDFKGSVTDFDRFLKEQPDRVPYHWQRGISQYCARLYKEGQDQFEVHQTVNRHDVENAVWHFLCTTRLEGLEAARRKLIPIEGDQRIPMAEIHRLFAGAGSEKDVLAAADASQDAAGAKAHRQRRCYAHLYLGLYYEATGEDRKALANLKLAAEKYSLPGSYMGEVARVWYAHRQKDHKTEASGSDDG